MKCCHPVLTAVVVVLLGSLAWCETPGTGDNVTPTSGPGDRQRHVQLLMQQLDTTIRRLAESLAKTEPERSARLQKALAESKQLSLERRMAAITQMLDDAHLDKATDEQKKVLTDLQRLVDVLLGEDGRNDKAAAIEQLGRWRDQVRALIGEEQAHLGEAGKVADKDKTTAELQRQIEEVEKLIKRQQTLIEQTQQSRQQGIDGLHGVADRQHELRQETEKVAKRIDGGAASNDQNEGQDGKPGQPGDESGSKPVEMNKPQPADGNQPGGKPLGEAARHQKKAENNLDNGRGKAGQQEQEVALTELKKALEDLKNEKSRIASLPPEALDQLAEKQRNTADKTGQLGNEIAESGQKDGLPGESQPAQQAVKSAQGQMQQAGKELGRHQPAEAVPPAAGAVTDLKKALKEIEDKLAQLREEERLEKLARLEARFREMLARQQAATKATTEIEKHRATAGTLRRSDILQLGKQTDEERALAKMADEALEIIREDGTSVVFPRIVDRLYGDLKRVALWLEQKETGRRTNLVQVEIERTLDELVLALEEAQKKSKPGQPGEPGQSPSEKPNQDEPLMPDSAELKLLRAAQERVNRMTSEFDEHRAGRPLDEPGREEVHQISQRQQDIAIMTQEMIERK